MLTLLRMPGAYDRATLVLVEDGVVLGEIIVLQVIGGQVRLGLNMANSIEIVRADARQRPSGPSTTWLAERAQAFASGAFIGVFPCASQPDDAPDMTLQTAEETPLYELLARMTGDAS